MDGLVFIATLVVAAAVIGWYVANEVKHGDGGTGLLALRSDTAQADIAPAPEAGARYRQRPRLAPARRAPIAKASGRAYRPLAPMNSNSDDFSETASEDDF